MSRFSDNPLLRKSNGILALDKVVSDKKNALSKGRKMLLLEVLSYCIPLSASSRLVKG